MVLLKKIQQNYENICIYIDILQIQDDGIYKLLYVFKLSNDDVDPTNCFTKELLVTINHDWPLKHPCHFEGDHI